jgi:hypothetical protein
MHSGKKLRDIGLLQEEVEFLKADRVAFQLLAEKGFHGFRFGLWLVIADSIRNPWRRVDAGSSPA